MAIGRIFINPEMKLIGQNGYINIMIRRLWLHFYSDSLFRNSIYLMMATVVMAGLGFFFWIINTRLFTTEQVGLATTMISIMGLITSFSLLGLDVGLIRYLPKSERKNEQINTCISATSILALILSTIFLVGINIFSPKLVFITKNPYFILLFILFMVFSTFNSLIENIFIAFRDTKFILIKNTVFSVLKLILPFFLISLGTFGIFSSWMSALTISLGISILILVIKFDFKPRLILNKNIIEEIGRFSLGNYVAGFFNSLPLMLLPLMITNLINPETTAYYYMAMMVANLLFAIPQATTQSLFAEGSHDVNELKQHTQKAIKTIAVILIPITLITVLLGKYVLLTFGKNYSAEGFRFLQILALSGIFVAINSIFGAILKIRREIKKMIMINILGAILILGLSYLFLPFGLIGIGLAWISGQGLLTLVYLYYEGWVGVKNFFIYFVHNNGIPFINYIQIWSIGIYTGKSPEKLNSTKKVTNPVITAKDVTDVPAKIVADPFMIKESSIWYMFFEVVNKNTNRGEIGSATSNDGFTWTYKQIVLVEPFHLSYPYIFKWNGEYYMIPESYGTNSIRLYKAASFPFKWSFVSTLLEGKDYADSSITYFHNKWWLFTSSTKSNILRLYYSEQLTGSWIEHPKSPLFYDNAHISRPAGRVTQFNGNILRYTQDDIPTYGNQVRAFEIIELTTTNYKEIEVKGNPILKANGTGWNANGVHHVDPHQLEKNKWIACVDGNIEVLKIGPNL